MSHPPFGDGHYRAPITGLIAVPKPLYPRGVRRSGPMTGVLQPSHLSMLRSPEPGTHAILWSDGTSACDIAIETFLRGGVERDDMVMVVMPRKELADLEERLRARGTDLDSMVDEGHLFRSLTEDVMPRHLEEVERMPRDMAAIWEFARSVGKEGLTVLDRIPALCFDRGKQEMAERIEQTAQDNRGASRMLCLYDGKNLSAERFSNAVSLTRMHTEALTAVGGGRFFIESTNGSLSP